MLVLKYVISGLLLWLSVGQHQEFDNTSLSPDLHSDTVTSSIHKKHHGLISDISFELNPVDLLYKTSKTSFGFVKNRVLRNANETYNHELLYFKIGSNIPLQLTTRKRIFPFHCFT